MTPKNPINLKSSRFRKKTYILTKSEGKFQSNELIIKINSNHFFEREFLQTLENEITQLIHNLNPSLSFTYETEQKEKKIII